MGTTRGAGSGGSPSPRNQLAVQPQRGIVPQQALLPAARGHEVYVLADVSGSMQGRERYVGPGLGQAHAKMREAGVKEVSYILFSNSIKGWPDANSLAPRPIEQVAAPTTEMLEEGEHQHTALVDAYLAAFDQIESRSSHASARVVAFTDGLENASAWSTDPSSQPATIERFRQMQQKGVYIALIGFVRKQEESKLRELATALGITAIELFFHTGDDRSVQASAGHTVMSVTRHTTGNL